MIYPGLAWFGWGTVRLGAADQDHEMNQYRLSIALLFAMLAGPVVADDSLDLQVDRFLGDEVRKREIPGLALAVVMDGEVVYKGAIGVRKLGDPEVLTPEHVFHLASVSKTFVATAIMQLVEQGKLELSDTLVQHLPYFRLADDRYKTITIRQVLNHTSGMPNVDEYQWGRGKNDVGAAERYVREMAPEKLLSAPGEKWAYSDMAVDVLGDLIAKVSGVSFEDYIQVNILQPLKMTNSSFYYPDIDSRLRVSGHVGKPARVGDIYPYNRRHAPSSTLNSSANDMIRWILVNLNRGELDGERLLSAQGVEILWTPTAEIGSHGSRMGLSWFLRVQDGRRMVYHLGGDTGFKSYLVLLPDDGIGILLASNWSGTGRTEIVAGVLKLLLD